MSTLASLLSEAGIRLKRMTPGHTEVGLICPACGGGRTKEKSFNVTVDQDCLGFTGVCHRGSCAHTVGKRVHDERATPRRDPKPSYTAPPAHKAFPRPPELIEWFAKRGISQRTLEHFNVYQTTRQFPGEDLPLKAVVLPYVWHGVVVNRKYRPLAKKHPMAQESNALPTMFNADAILGDSPVEKIVFCEGEMDCLACYEASTPQQPIPPAVSLKDGATEGELGKKLAAFETHAAELARVKLFILAGDADGPGRHLMEEIARRVGRHRCSVVTWPEDCKDANDVLVKHGAGTLYWCIKEAAPYPISGLQPIRPGDVTEWLNTPREAMLTLGTYDLDRKMGIPPDGRLIVITGVPGHGKALALSTPVATPDGWSTIGDLKVGDSIFSQDGSITKVTHIHPILHDRECFEVTMKHGEKIIADAEHLWLTRCDKARRSELRAFKKRGSREETLPRGTDQRHLRTFPSLKTTRDLAKNIVVNKKEAGRRTNHAIRVCSPLVGAPWNFPIAPYTLGAWLGDGTSDSSNITCADLEIIENIRLEGYEVKKTKTTKYGWRISRLQSVLRKTELLGAKSIPQKLLRADAESRLSLLQGLMDTDGYICRDGQAEFCSIKKVLADSVFELVASFGLKPRMLVGSAKLYGKDCGKKYRVMFNPSLPVFRIARKTQRLRTAKISIQRALWWPIFDVKPTESVPVRCITVDHPSGMFLAGKSMVPTHNSTFFTFVMVNLMERHDRKFAVFTPEMAPWQRYAAHCIEVKTGKARSNLTPVEMANAEIWLSKRLVLIEADAVEESLTLDWMLERAEAAIIRYGITDLGLDPWNELDHSRPDKERSDEYTSKALRKTKHWSKRYGCNVWILAHPIKLHPAKPGGKMPMPTLYDIKGGSEFADKTDLALAVYRPDDATHVEVLKAKFAEYGCRGNFVRLGLNQDNQRYYDSPEDGTEPPLKFPNHFTD